MDNTHLWLIDGGGTAAHEKPANPSNDAGLRITAALTANQETADHFDKSVKGLRITAMKGLPGRYADLAWMEHSPHSIRPKHGCQEDQHLAPA